MIELKDTIYVGGIKAGEIKSRALTPVSMVFTVKVNRRFMREFRREFRYVPNKTISITPNWYLRRLVKMIYGK